MIGIECNVAFCDVTDHQAESRVVMIGDFELPPDLQVNLVSQDAAFNGLD